MFSLYCMAQWSEAPWTNFMPIYDWIPFPICRFRTPKWFQSAILISVIHWHRIITLRYNVPYWIYCTLLEMKHFRLVILSVSSILSVELVRTLSELSNRQSCWQKKKLKAKQRKWEVTHKSGVNMTKISTFVPQRMWWHKSVHAVHEADVMRVTEACLGCATDSTNILVFPFWTILENPLLYWKIHYKMGIFEQKHWVCKI